jgi:hypothetical protein
MIFYVHAMRIIFLKLFVTCRRVPFYESNTFRTPEAVLLVHKWTEDQDPAGIPEFFPHEVQTRAVNFN